MWVEQNFTYVIYMKCSLLTHLRFKFTWTWCQCASQDSWLHCTISDTIESSESVDEPPAQGGVPEEADEDKSGLVGCEPAVTHMGDATHTLVADSEVENAGYNVMQVVGLLLTTPSAFQQLLEHWTSFEAFSRYVNYYYMEHLICIKKKKCLC